MHRVKQKREIMINLVVDNTKLSAEDKAFEDEMDHFYNLKDELGYDTTW